MIVYVCGVWRPSKSSMPVTYQHIFAIPVIILHNLSSFHLSSRQLLWPITLLPPISPRIRYETIS